MHWDNSRDDWYRNAYEVYTTLGGYPEVITAYFGQKQESFIQSVKKKTLRLVSDELKLHQDGMDDKVMSGRFFRYLVSYIMTEKRGKNFVKGFSEFISNRSESSALKTKEVKNCLSWFIDVGVIDVCDMYNFVIKMNDAACRMYFRDLGILYDVLQSSSVKQSDKAGIVAENFVFKTLNENFDVVPKFGVYNDGKIDFVFCQNGIVYGIEVENGKNMGKTAMKLLQSHKIDKLIYFNGNTDGGVTGDIITLPIWASTVCKYDFVGTRTKPLHRLHAF